MSSPQKQSCTESQRLLVKPSTSSSSMSPKSMSSSDLQFTVHGVPFALSKELLATKSAKVAAILEKNPHDNLSQFLRNIPVDDSETFELVARFCHGYELQMSTENVIPLICIAYHLEMTENHATSNLLTQAYTFFQRKVLPSWNETIKACRVAENFLQQAMNIGLVDACLESLIAKALIDPQLLGEPVKIHTSDDYNYSDQDGYKPNARRKLFVLNWKSEDLTTLSLQLYEPLILSMHKRGVSSEYVAASICQYAKRWVFSSSSSGGRECNLSIYINRNSQREIIEAVEVLLPHEKGLSPCTLLFEMLHYAIALEASSDCRTGLEIRIGQQLDQATVKDLLITSKGYAKDGQYDTECLRRILKNFYCTYSCSDISNSGFVTVADLVEDFLAEVAADIDLKMDTFISIAEMANAVSSALGTQRHSDGLYRAIDIYFDKHRYLTEIEREEVCGILDCQKMTPEACEHAAKNERLPLRVVVQVLFVTQLQLRDTITKVVQHSDEKLVEEAEDDEAAKEQVMKEMKIMSDKVMQLERECFIIRRGLVDKSSSLTNKKEKISMWKEMKRKFGCITTIHDCNCQVKKKKVHPRIFAE